MNTLKVIANNYGSLYRATLNSKEITDTFLFDSVFKTKHSGRTLEFVTLEFKENNKEWNVSFCEMDVS